MSGSRLARALAAIDAVNAGDPNQIVVRGETRPKELAHAALMTEWVTRLDPTADDAQHLAARAHHLRRWSLPRSTYPEGRAGYLRWRSDLRKQHAEEVAGILESAGCDEPTIANVQALIRKEGLGRDRRAQVHEDALCLVFLETQLAATVERLGEEKMLGVIAKTVAKMSPHGIAHVSELPLRPSDRALIDRAVSG